MVYVGKREYKFGRMKMSHMIADSLEELHDMAEKIGMRLEWFQNKPGKPHYDVPMFRKKRAILAGAIEVDDRFIVNKLKEIYGS